MQQAMWYQIPSRLHPWWRHRQRLDAMEQPVAFLWTKKLPCAVIWLAAATIWNRRVVHLTFSMQTLSSFNIHGLGLNNASTSMARMVTPRCAASHSSNSHRFSSSHYHLVNRLEKKKTPLRSTWPTLRWKNRQFFWSQKNLHQPLYRNVF